MRAPPSFFGYLIFAAPVLRALLATRKRDDLAIAVSACVVGGFPSPYSFFLLAVCNLSVGKSQRLADGLEQWDATST
ncbi:hypothetical protein K474DRAFT_1668786 [Panus rudis PR-1116 ss-1]|nr:hypothetical protein K474DRAFT_1668786 [Panus rudis PR-1116 ss-1]